MGPLQGWNKLWKTGKARKFGCKAPEIFFCNCPLLFQFALHPTYWGHMPFFALQLHTVSIMSLKGSIGLPICRHCVDQKTDWLVFTEFQSDHRVKPMKSGRAKISPLASKSGGAFALPALQLVPPLARWFFWVANALLLTRSLKIRMSTMGNGY